MKEEGRKQIERVRRGEEGERERTNRMKGLRKAARQWEIRFK